MKKIVAVLLMTLTIGFWAARAQAQAPSLVPEIKFGKDQDLRLAISGFAQATYSRETDGPSAGNDDWSWTNLRPRLTLSLKDHWEIGTVINFADLQEPDSNWLRELYVGYKFDEKWKLSVGRVYLAAGYHTPDPFVIETVNYPLSDPFNTYAWGVLLEGSFGRDWSVKAAVSGVSGLAFSDAGCWNGLEFSARLEKKFEQKIIGATLQASGDFCRIGTDFTWKPVSQFYIRAGLAYSDNADSKASNRLGGYASGAYRPVKWFEFHSQFDNIADIQKSYHEWQKSENDDGSITVDRVKCFTSNETDVIWTNGIRLFAGKNDLFSFTVDYETAIDGTKPDRFLARTQFLF